MSAPRAWSLWLRFSYPRAISWVLSITVVPLAIRPAITRATPALISGDVRCLPLNSVGPFTMTLCGSQVMMLAPMEVSESVNKSLPSNIHS